MATTWQERVKPNTNRWQRVKPETDWDGRVRPITYMTPLQDAYTEVADEDDEIIYILADSGKLIPATFWKARPQII